MLSKSIFCAAIFISFFLLTNQSPAQQPASNTTINIDSTTADIVQARTFTSQYVLLANSRFKSDSPQYTQAYKLYAKAYSDYTAWNSYLASAIRSGRTKRLPSDPKYAKAASTASQSAAAFTNYVDVQTSQSKAITTALTALAGLGIDLWTKWSNKISAERTAAATAFTTDTKWQSWNEIVSGIPSGTAKPEPKATPTLNK